MSEDIADSFHCLFQMIEDCIYIHRMDGRIVAVNNAVLKTHDLKEEDFIGKTPEDFAVPGYNDMENIREYWWKCLQGEPQRFEFWSQTLEGRVFPKEVIINCGNYAGEKVIIAVARDITHRKELEDQLRHLADNDELTALYNRRVFFEMSEKAVSYCKRYEKPLSCLIVDLDHFKQINDSFGHPGGDVVLKSFGRLLANSARASDIVARIGGEEFAIVMPRTNLQQATHWAESLTKTLSEKTFSIEQEKLRVSVSIGISTLDEEVSDITALIKMADRALYQAKAAGRDCYKVA